MGKIQDTNIKIMKYLMRNLENIRHTKGVVALSVYKKGAVTSIL
jgi:hypothetical protein